LKKVKKGMAIAGLVCSLLGVGIASWQWYVLNEAANELKDIDTTELQRELDSM
jgi:hypothetical protein